MHEGGGRGSGVDSRGDVCRRLHQMYISMYLYEHAKTAQIKHSFLGDKQCQSA